MEQIIYLFMFFANYRQYRIRITRVSARICKNQTPFEQQ